MERFVVTMHGEVSAKVAITPADERLDVKFVQAWLYCDNKPRQVGLNHDYILIFYPISGVIMHANCEYDVRTESRFTCYTNCYVTWCYLTTGIFASQWRGASDLLPEITPPERWNMARTILPQLNILTHWGRDKWPPFSRRYLQMHFLKWKCINFD